MTTPAAPLQPDGSPRPPDDAAADTDADVPSPVVASRHPRLPMIDVWVWTGIAALLLLIRVSPGFAPDLYNDSFQYLSVAGNTLDGQFGQTSLVHFDVERSFGTIPAPSVTTAAGLSTVIALLSLAGLSLQGAALVVSVVSTVACVPLLAWIAGQFGFSRLLRNVVLACFVFNGAAIQFGAAALSEALFTFVVLLGLALLVAAQFHRETGAWWLWATAGLAFGGAYLVRYAGLFFVIGLGLLVVRHLLTNNRSLARGHALALAVSILPVAAGIARNIALVGDWRGGNAKVAGDPLPTVLLDVVRGASAPFLGSSPGTLLLRGSFVVLFLAAIVWLIWSYMRGRDAQARIRPGTVSILTDFLILAAVYTAGVIYAGLFSVIPPNPRYFVPLTPMLLLIVGAALQGLLASPGRGSRATRDVPVILLGASFCVYMLLNIVAFRQPPIDRAALVASQMDMVSGDGTSARASILAHVGANQVIIANNGQAVGYVLGLPTVSLVGPHYTDVEWDEATIRETARRIRRGSDRRLGPTARRAR